jgi:hypothetical protein
MTDVSNGMPAPQSCSDTRPDIPQNAPTTYDNPPMGFVGLDRQDGDHMATVGRPSTFIAPALAGRAAKLREAMQTLSDIRPHLTSRYLVKGWLDRGGASVVYGEPNAGKTFFALDLAFHIAARLPWHGVRVDGQGVINRKCRVIYIACEGGTGVDNRVEAMKLERPDIAAQAADGSFTLMKIGMDLHGQLDAEALGNAISELDEKPTLIVVDTLARTMGDGDENTSKDMGLFIRSIDYLRERLGVHVMLIHHSGKDASKGARGSSSLRGAVDTEISLTRSGDVVTAEVVKQRDGPCGGMFCYKLKTVELGEDQDGEPVTSAIITPAEQAKKTIRLSGKNEIAMQALYDALREHGEAKTGTAYPANRKAVQVDLWRASCGVHGLTNGITDAAARMAFKRAKDKLMDLNAVREWGGYVWRVQDED